MEWDQLSESLSYDCKNKKKKKKTHMIRASQLAAHLIQTESLTFVPSRARGSLHLQQCLGPAPTPPTSVNPVEVSLHDSVWRTHVE